MLWITAPLLIIYLFFTPPTAATPAGARDGDGRDPQGQEPLTKEQEAALSEAKKLYEEAERLYKENNYDGAIERVERALPVMEKVLGEAHQHVIATLNNLAGMYQAKNNYPAAERLFKRVLEIREKKFGAEHPDIAETLTDLGGLYREKGEYAAAEPALRRALDIREKAAGDNPRPAAAALNNLALLYKQTGQYERSEELYRRSLKLVAERLGEEHVAIASVLSNLAALYREKGDYTQAEQLSLHALRIREKVLGPTHVEVATIINNLGGLYREKGDYVAAEQMYLRALKIRESALRPDQPVIATSLNNLASLYHEKGDFDRAEQMYQRALAIRERAYGSSHPAVAVTLTNMARLRRDRGDYAAAEALLRRALDVRERALGSDHPSVASVLDSLSFIEARRGNYDSARALLERSLSIRILKFGEEHRTVVQSLLRLGNLAIERGEHSRAESFLRRALASGKKSLGPTHPIVASVLTGMSILYQARGDAAQALPFQEESDRIREQRLSLILTTGSESQRRLYVETLAGQTSIAVSLHALRAPSDGPAARHALTTLLQRKGRVLDVLAGDIGALRQRLDPEGVALLNQLTSAQSALAALSIGGDESARRGAEQAQLEARVEQLEAQISERAARLNAGGSPFSLDDVQRVIPAGSALVEIARYWQYDARGTQGRPVWRDEHYIAYVVRKQGPPAFADLGDAREIDDQVYRLRVSLRDPRRADVREVAAATEARVMRPIRRLLGNTSHVFIAPDSTLNLLPFGALTDERGRYLIERYSFTYLTSGRDLLRLGTRERSKQRPVVMANPLFDVPQGAAPTPPGNVRRFEPLPGTIEEATAVGGLLGVEPLTGAQATESALKQVRGPSILHIATHGFFSQARRRNADAPDMLEQLHDLTRPPAFDVGENLLLNSGLALYGANDRRDGEGGDGILTALEASGLDLSGTMLAVLSACETGVGRVLNGEGVYGLRRALVLAGAESQVISLWKADDRITRDLMTAYYRKLRQGIGRTEALQLAQMEILRDPEHAHPYYWACFIPSGDWKPIGALRTDGR